MKQQKRKKKSRFGSWYRIVLLDDSSLEVLWRRRVSKQLLTLWLLGVTVSIGAMLLAVFLYTPVRDLLPTSSEGDILRSEVEMMTHKLDSLNRGLRVSENYIEGIRLALSGEPIELKKISDSTNTEEGDSVSSDVHFNVSDLESQFRESMEKKLLEGEHEEDEIGLFSPLFFTPIEGIISSKINTEVGHYGVDIASNKDAPVYSVLDGVVVFVSYTIESGFAIVVQHTEGFLSIYKHCASSAVKQGDHVRSGQVIGRAGGIGEISTGPHLHFELWHEGSPVDPNIYIKFK